MIPIPLSRFIIMRIISSLSFIASAIIVFVVKNKIEEKRYEKFNKEMVPSSRRR